MNEVDLINLFGDLLCRQVNPTASKNVLIDIVNYRLISQSAST